MPKTTPTLDIQTALDTELNRLLALNLSPEHEEIARRYYSQKERDSLDSSDFCGPHQSFPVKSQEDVDNAAGLAGHADNPDAVRACIRSKAKKHGWKLPESWTEDGATEKADTPDSTRAGDPGLVIGADGSHKPFTGLHIHNHSAFGDQGDDGMHDHKHEHNNDSNHQHSHSHLDGNWQAKGEGSDKGTAEKADTPDITRSMPSETTFYAPIMRIDRDRREVVLRATAEAFDSYGTVIGFDGSKQAFGKWRGNIREMHDPTKAVGRALKYDPVEEEKAIDLTLRVSKGAEDTWQKCLDGTLAGGSIGARNGVWEKRIIDGKEVPFLARYDLVEVSLVDNPSCPGCDVKIVRADNLATDVLDFSEETPVQPEQQQAEITRVGARIATNTMMSMHKSRDHAALGLREQLANCSCDECQSALNTLDPDGDGDVDILASLDTDHDAAGQAEGDGSGSIMKYVETEITRHLAPTVQRINGVAARLAALDTHTTTTTQEPDPELTRRFESLEQRLTGLDEVRSLLSEVKGLAEQIAAQPQPGGPIVNSAALRSQVPDQSAFDPLSQDAASIARLAKAGLLNHNQQIEAALYLERQRTQGNAATRR